MALPSGAPSLTALTFWERTIPLRQTSPPDLSSISCLCPAQPRTTTAPDSMRTSLLLPLIRRLFTQREQPTPPAWIYIGSHLQTIRTTSSRRLIAGHGPLPD